MLSITSTMAKMNSRSAKYKPIGIKIGYVGVELYTKDEDGNWNKKTEHRTVVNWDDK